MKLSHIAIWSVTCVAFGLACNSEHRLPSGETAREVFSSKRVYDFVVSATSHDRSSVRRFIGEGVDVDSRGLHNVTPLWWMLYSSSERGFDLLLELGTNANIQPDGIESVPYLASAHRNPAFLKALLKWKANLDTIDHEAGEPPIFAAIAASRETNIALLLDAKVDLNLKDRDGNDAALFAAFSSRYDLVHKILATGRVRPVTNSYGASLSSIIGEDMASGIGASNPWLLRVKGDFGI